MELNRQNIKKIMGIIIASILIYAGVQHLDVVKNVIDFILRMLTPFLLGAGVAFILNTPMRFFERLLFTDRRYGDKKWARKIKRPVSILITLLLVTGLIAVVFIIILPEIGRTFGILSDNLPAFGQRIEGWANELMAKYPEAADRLFHLEVDWDKLWQSSIGWLQNSAGLFVTSTIGLASSIIGGLVNFILGLIFAIYLLMQKETISRQVKRVFYAFLPEKKTDRLLEICSLSNLTFSRFLSGQLVEAVIIGVLFFITMTIFRMPYTLLISILIAFTALIPIVGAFIGCIVGAFLILIVEPMTAFWFILLFLVVQQVEGNVIYPKIVGTSIGLPSIWVLLAVTVGGSLMGILGILLFIPLCSVLYAVSRGVVKNRLQKRGIAKEKLQ